MNGQAIPGFYFDPEKKKYFRIQGQVAARGSNLKYSLDNIRKEERKERLQKAATARDDRIRRQRVVRRHASTLLQTEVERELGFRRRSFYMQNLWPDACIAGVSKRPKQILDKPHDASIRYFDRDPISKTMYAVHGENRVKRRRIHTENGPPLPRHDDPEAAEYFNPWPLNSYSFEPWDELTRTTSTVSSLSYLPATGALATTTYGSDRPPVVYLSDPERDGPYVGQQFTPKGCTAIWGAAARPTSFSPSPGLANSVAATHTEHLAVAASNSMLIFTRSPTGTWDSQTAVRYLNSDILALDWISYTTIALGCRDGKIRLHDTRSGGSSHILTHPYPISKLKRADNDTRLICSGLQDSLFLYDIRSPRFSRPSSSSQSYNYDNHHYNEQYFKTLYPGNRDSKKRRKLNHSAFRNWSQPVLSFAHHNLDDLELDIDVHPRLGLLAASQDSATGTAIRISNIWTGRTIKEIKSSGDTLRNKEGLNKVRSLKFIESEQDDGLVDLWACWDGGVARIGW
ncbi:Nn.00g079460.m01.CDS01 [Neocucurbitaria sp. VM-36]